MCAQHQTNDPVLNAWARATYVRTSWCGFSAHVRARTDWLLQIRLTFYLMHSINRELTHLMFSTIIIIGPIPAVLAIYQVCLNKIKSPQGDKAAAFDDIYNYY